MAEVELRHMSREEFVTYYAQAVESYAEELLRSGRFPDEQEAKAFARWEYQDIFSQGYETPETDVYHIDIHGEKGGIIWTLREGDTEFIGDFLIDSSFRRHGYSAKAMCCLEQIAKQSGIKAIRLGVFKSNAIARRLYEKQGYTVIRDREADLLMEKRLDS